MCYMRSSGFASAIGLTLSCVEVDKWRMVGFSSKARCWTMACMNGRQ